MPAPDRTNVCLELLAVGAGEGERGRLRALAVARQPGDESVAARAELFVRGCAQGAAPRPPTGAAVPMRSAARAGGAAIFGLQAELGRSDDVRSSGTLGKTDSTNQNVNRVRTRRSLISFQKQSFQSTSCNDTERIFLAVKTCQKTSRCL